MRHLHTQPSGKHQQPQVSGQPQNQDSTYDPKFHISPCGPRLYSGPSIKPISGSKMVLVPQVPKEPGFGSFPEEPWPMPIPVDHDARVDPLGLRSKGHSQRLRCQVHPNCSRYRACPRARPAPAGSGYGPPQHHFSLCEPRLQAGQQRYKI